MTTSVHSRPKYVQKCSKSVQKSVCVKWKAETGFFYLALFFLNNIIRDLKEIKSRGCHFILNDSFVLPLRVLVVKHFVEAGDRVRNKDWGELQRCETVEGASERLWLLSDYTCSTNTCVLSHSDCVITAEQLYLRAPPGLSSCTYEFNDRRL